MADDKTTDKPLAMKPEDAIWVICASPVTLLMPIEGTATSHIPLKLERGLNVLVGPVLTEAGTTRWLTLDGLPSSLQQMPPEERGHAAHKLFREARKLYDQYFVPTGKIPARVSAVGTMAQLLDKHFAGVLEGARLGTHRASLEGLLHFPGTSVPEHVKTAARTRLAAWRSAA